jgi:hypothetical protein
MRPGRGAVSTAALVLCCLAILAVTVKEAKAGLTLIARGDLVFGRYATSVTQGGTVTINPATGGKSVTGSVYDMGGAHQRARFDVEDGSDDATIVITLPSQITITSGGNSMTVDAFTSDPSGTAVLDDQGEGQFYVGATLNLSANQAAGVYTGQFTVTINYQ